MFLQVEIWNLGHTEKGIAIFFRLPQSPLCVPIHVDSHEAQYLFTALSGIQEDPPKLPEVFRKFASMLSVQTESVRIYKQNDTQQYMTKISFRSENQQFNLSCSTPEALALAIRFNTPIFIENQIAKNDSIAVNRVKMETPFTTQLTHLQNELDKRVDEEDYETAANIRDHINQLMERRPPELE